MQTLNVGCGPDMWGDVRVDVNFNFLMMYCKPTLLASAQYLPFKDGSFEVVKSSHVLEHLENPFKALDEIMRVSTKKIFLSFPTQYDVLPWIFSSIFPIPAFSTLKLAYLTRKNRLHLWVINPRIVAEYLRRKSWHASYETLTVSLFSTLQSGRKGKYFLWLTKRFQISYEIKLHATIHPKGNFAKQNIPKRK